ncbi:outer envelope pore protein 37, chloroplastic-like [Cornus florida]|uniref:outer envelope pore protein 37, chloroplastic-like n=1 Tax=Cornus florida TaxID=4283 RepID=UPI00289771C5|nr:outer envelope pore protein 37, chloroplastic-like [Cornus florida]
MVKSTPQNPNSLHPPATASGPPLPSQGGGFLRLPWRPRIRVTSEFNSVSSIFLHKMSCKLFEDFAKLKLCFQNNIKGEIFQPQVALTSNRLSLRYGLEDKNAFVKGCLDVGRRLQIRAAHDVIAQQLELSVGADIAGPAYKIGLPSASLPRANFKFPLGEVTLAEKEEEYEEAERMLSINGVLKGHIPNGVCTAQYANQNLKLRYCYKDEQMAIIPSISLRPNGLFFAFKVQFGPYDNLSYWYNFDSNYWSTVYKHTVGKDFKFKASYNSEVRRGWASLCVGDEGGSTKTAPLKMKARFMLQVPQDDIRSSALMFRVKKRWDI